MGVGFFSVEPGPTIAWGARRKSGFPTAETQHNNTTFNDEDSHNQKSTLDIGQLIITHNNRLPLSSGGTGDGGWLTALCSVENSQAVTPKKNLRIELISETLKMSHG